MKNKTLADRIKALALALGLSVLPAKEVNSADVSYGGSIGIDFNKNVSVGGYITSTDKANSLFGKVGLNYILNGADKGTFSVRLGGGYLFPNGLSPSIEGSYTPKSESPYSIGAGLGYSLVKKDGENGNGEGNNIDETLKCTGGTWTEEGVCECPEPYFPAGTGEGVACSKED